MLDYFGDFDERYYAAEFVQKFEDTGQKSTAVCTLLLLEKLGGAYLMRCGMFSDWHSGGCSLLLPKILIY